MFCTHCGKEIPDGSKNCMYCGMATNVSNVQDSMSTINTVETVAETVTETVSETVSNTAENEAAKEPAPVPQPVINNNQSDLALDSPKTKKDKKEKIGNAGVIVACLIFLLIIIGAGVGAYLFINSPYNKIKKAINANDVATVCELYPELNNNEQEEYVANSMWNYAVELEKKFQDNEIEYDDAMEDINPISKVVLKNDKELKALMSDMSDLNDSRVAFAAAEKAFKKEDYQTAYDNYSLVIKDDSNYKTAQKQLEICEEYLRPDFLGRWELDYDMGEAFLDSFLSDSVDSKSQYTVSWPAIMYFQFNEDGTGCIELDEDAFNEGKEQAIEDMVSIYYDLLEEETGLSKLEIDEMLYYAGNDSLEDMVKDQFEESGLSISNTRAPFTYEVNDDGDCITITRDSDKQIIDINFEMPDENTFTITGGWLAEPGNAAFELPASCFRIE